MIRNVAEMVFGYVVCFGSSLRTVAKDRGPVRRHLVPLVGGQWRALCAPWEGNRRIKPLIRILLEKKQHNMIYLYSSYD